jgi:menaquinone-dependent protoporphyrinogen oxidase
MTNTTDAKKILMLYSSVDGQTIKIIEYFKQGVEQEVELLDVETNPNIEFSHYQKVLVGASVRYGKLRPSFIRFVNQHKQQLDALPNAFFLVCLTARKPEKAIPENNAYMRKFDLLSQWQPKQKAVFAGALLYSRYNWWQTLIIQLIMKITGGSTDKTKDIELTDWQKVDQFSQHFKNL